MLELIGRGSWKEPKVTGPEPQIYIFFALLAEAGLWGVFFLVSVVFTTMGNAAGNMEVPLGKEGKASSLPGSTGHPRQMGIKLPMPAEEELEQRFSAVLVSRRKSSRQTRCKENKEF